ncbi:Isoprimeverose transporter [Neobacillus rhizosphaerae]|uniref:Isoprimeverose transporter n=1 Tax=Neobacillus rhizosphaerae TaxID=2880965 RepID=A0ABM9EKN5_9BACI|nr:glycoside-pentoside-hexuronide (GPH):cation symporter [Neobacillus rhizosphaerae]CAH2713144.1 Isoprimeverose transporter [Neobacillus rhizosphaerae]
MSSINANAKKSEITLYSFGGFGSNLLYVLTTSFLLYFYTDVFKISPIAVGSVFLIVRLIDAILDPMIGMLADRTNSKWGTYRPWLIFGSPLLAMVTLLLFTAPHLSPSAKIYYAIATYVGYSFVSSIVNIPYHSLTAILSQDSSQRTVIATAKQFMGTFGALVASAAVLPLIALFGSGQKGWFFTTLLFSILSIASFWLCAHGAKRHDIKKVNSKNDSSSIDGHPTLKAQINIITKNKPLLLLLIAFLANMVAFVTSISTSIYYWQYNIGRLDLFSKLNLWGTLISIPVFMLIPPLVKKFGKKHVYMYASLFSIIPFVVILLIPYKNVMPIFVLSIIISLIGPLTSVLPWTMLPDCVDYGKWKTGINGSGTVHSMAIFTNKVGGAIGGLISGAVLGAVGYVAGQHQTPEVLKTIGYMNFLVPILGYIVIVIVMKFYPITNEFSAKMVEEINNREKKNEAAV